jgi:hypothetical protein
MCRRPIPLTSENILYSNIHGCDKRVPISRYYFHHVLNQGLDRQTRESITGGGAPTIWHLRTETQQKVVRPRSAELRIKRPTAVKQIPHIGGDFVRLVVFSSRTKTIEVLAFQEGLARPCFETLGCQALVHNSLLRSAKMTTSKSSTYPQDQQLEGIDVRAFRGRWRGEIGGFAAQNRTMNSSGARYGTVPIPCASNYLGEAEIANTRNSVRVDEHVLLAEINAWRPSAHRTRRTTFRSPWTMSLSCI